MKSRLINIQVLLTYSPNEVCVGTHESKKLNIIIMWGFLLTLEYLKKSRRYFLLTNSLSTPAQKILVTYMHE